MGVKETGHLVELTIPARAEYIGVARLLVSGVANRAGFSYDEIEDIKLAVAEACTNAIHHAYGEGANGSVRILCMIYEDRLQIQIIDWGASFDPERVERKLGPFDKDADIDSLTEGGLGLFLIQSVMDDVQIDADNGCVVTMTKYVRRDEVAKHVDEQSKAKME
ncbi:anti-sigma B factor RsbW [Brevibacillus humidisoli]|uniref:anti-sigma B factor RsbW n=1 Tax=Brevibacillus humidisoli TaxID=2895522 RepID=UPI001E52D6D5|nr:anti-sigma B factor RsbW [Brevibacillus humidisoli]UFJ40950.1 anti-sigma B factor RsbW [Brevibacillus humidisoli]